MVANLGKIWPFLAGMQNNMWNILVTLVISFFIKKRGKTKTFGYKYFVVRNTIQLYWLSSTRTSWLKNACARVEKWGNMFTVPYSLRVILIGQIMVKITLKTLFKLNTTTCIFCKKYLLRWYNDCRCGTDCLKHLPEGLKT